MSIKFICSLFCILLLFFSITHVFSQSTTSAIPMMENDLVTRTFGYGGLKVRAVANFGVIVALDGTSQGATVGSSFRWSFIGEATPPSQTYDVVINFYTLSGVQVGQPFRQTFVVTSIAPTALLSGSNNAISEGEFVFLSFDPVLNDSPQDTEAGFLYSFDCNGDGNFEVIDISDSSYGCQYSDNGVFRAQGRVTDKDGHYTDDHFYDVSVSNVHPSAQILNMSGDISTDAAVMLEFSSIFDPSSMDTLNGFFYSYDCTDDGSFEMSISSIASYSGCIYSQYGTYTVRGRIQDKDGEYSDSFATVVVSFPIPEVCAPIGVFASIIVRREFSYEPIIGTDGNDLILGTNGDDYIDGLAGNDCILGQEGSDEIRGGADNDLIFGGSGQDGLYGGEGNDAIYGEYDSDLISGGAGDDYLSGDDSSDCILGGDGNDVINAGTGNDNPVVGNNGDDVIYGGEGDDTLYGDALTGDSGSHGLPAEDASSPGDDTIYGETGYDELFGNNGNDWLEGGDSADQLYGENGNDILTGGTDSDYFNGGFDADTANDYSNSIDNCQEVEEGCI